MQGRYGIDDFYFFLLYFYISAIFVNLFLKLPSLFYVELLVFALMFYRVFSKNLENRRRENRLYLRIREKALKPFQNIKRNWNARKEYIYKKCHSCKTTLRIPIPSERGWKHVNCPKCKKRLTVFCLRREKVEIITASGKRKYN